jgi:hypothetical protein
MSDPYMDVRKDLDRIKKLMKRLHMIKEQEISFRRLGKRMPASRIKEMREMETTIETVMGRPQPGINIQQKNLFESFRNNYISQMRSWKNRLTFAERQRFRRAEEEREKKHLE